MYITEASSLLAIISVFFIGLFVYFKGKNKSENQIFVLLTLAISLWNLGIHGLISGNTEYEALLWMKVVFFGSIFIPVLFFQFVFALIGERPKKGLLALLWGLALFFFLASPTKFYAKGVLRFNDVYFADAGIGLALFIAMFLLVTTYALYKLFQGQARARGQKQTQLFWIFLASLIYIVGEEIVIPTLFNLPFLGAYPWWNYTSLVFAAIIAYAITKCELMDIRVVIPRSVAYGIVGTFLVISFFILNLFSMPTIMAMLANAFLGLFWAFAAHRWRRFIQTPLEEKWITDFYDSDKLVNNIVRGFSPIIEKEVVFDLVAKELKQSIKIKEVDILKPDDSNNGLQDVVYDRHQAKVFIPLRSSDALEAVLSLGDKVSEDPYSEKDLTLFKTIMIQAQVVLDRIRPYEKIKKEIGIKEKKLYEAQIELERSSRLASLGTLTSGVTHEIRNPLCVIRTETERLPDKERDLDYLKEHSKLLLSQVKRIDSIVNRTLGLARGEQEVKEALNLNNVIEASVNLISATKANALTIKKELTDIPLIKGVPDELQQVFDNLIQNAFHAMEGGGTLTLKTYKDDSRVVAEITDTGAGIPEEIKDKIFDPFFSTRHDGAGLGLSIVYRIMQSQGGTIQFKSKVGEGTTFTLYFPVSS